MSWFNPWPRAFGSADSHRPASSSDTVHEELMFHFRELVHQKVAEGQAFDLAWDQAERQFGSLRRYEGECHSVQTERRLTWRIASALVVLLVLACVGWSSLERHETRLKDELHRMLVDLRNEQGEFVARQGQIVNDRFRSIVKEVSAAVIEPLERIREPGAKSAWSDGTDLTGLVLNEADQPLSEATVLVILKTWPDDQYRQEAFAATTDSQGKFLLPELVPSDGQFAVQVAALKEGFAFKSFYQLVRPLPSEQLEPITLRLQPASALTVIVRNEKGEPVPNAQVTPFARKSKQGDDHQIYFQGSEPAHRTTDAQGRVSLNCFLIGDTAEIYVQSPESEWNQRAFEISANETIVEVASLNANVH